MSLIVKLRHLILLATFFVTATNAATPVQFSFFNFNLPPDSQVIGVRMPIFYGKGGGDIRGFDLPMLAYSEMNSMKGIAVPPLFLLGGNRIQNEMTGISLGLFNWHQGYDIGMNLSLLNITNKVNGMNFGLVNVANQTRGLTFGLVNVADTGKGLNFGLFNYAGTYSMVDLALVNVTEKSNLQISLVNVTQELKGLQLGLLNCAKNSWLPCFIIFNIGL